MKRIAMALAALALATAAAAGSGQPKTADDFVALEQHRSASIAAHDMGWLQALYADDFAGITSAAYQVDKPTLMQVFGRDDPNTVFTLDDVKARLVGKDAAVTMGRVTGRNKAGEILSQFRFMHVYERRGGQWKLILGSGTDIPPARRTP